ncbi:MAG: N-acetyltransferase [Verrucomicrobia bacterium]|nr:MAG: N-acetyltransferase [Verrucomicrobiota bacterium]
MKTSRGSEPEVTVREAEAADAKAVLEYINEVAGETDFLDFGRGELGMTEEEEADFLDEKRQSANSLFLIAWVGDEIVGTLGFNSGHRPRRCHAGEFGISVRKHYWRMQIGSLLLDSLFAWARSGGVVTKINLQARADNERAIALYERKGFEREGRIQNAIRVDGKYHDTLCMGLIID